MVSFTQSRIGRRDAKTISARILTGIVRVLDFALLLIAAWLAAIGVGAWLQAPLLAAEDAAPTEQRISTCHTNRPKF
jgi:hypothetical protein